MRAVAMDKAKEGKSISCRSGNSVLQPTFRSFESLSRQLRGAECCDKMNSRCLVSLFCHRCSPGGQEGASSTGCWAHCIPGVWNLESS